MNLASYRRLLELVAQPGVLERVLVLLPVLCGLVGARDDQSIDWRVNRFLGIVSAMTPAEVEDRALLAEPSRRRRIACAGRPKGGIGPSRDTSPTVGPGRARSGDGMRSRPPTPLY